MLLRKTYGTYRVLVYIRYLFRDGFRAAEWRRKTLPDKLQLKSFHNPALNDVSEEELRRQRSLSDNAEIKFSVIVPLYNTRIQVLRDMIRSVREQTYKNWELCLADGSDGGHSEVGRVCRELRSEDPRIKYKKLEKNGGISENSNQCIAMATGEYFGLLDHDDILHPSALYKVFRAIKETGADFVYTDEAVFRSPDRRDIVSVHFKPDYSPENMLANNYICHFAVFDRGLIPKAGGAFRKAYDGSQDFDLFLRLTHAAKQVYHVPEVLYFWRSLPGSVASDIREKIYSVDSAKRAVKDFLMETCRVDASVESSALFPALLDVHIPLSGRPKLSVILRGQGDKRQRDVCLGQLRRMLLSGFDELLEENRVSEAAGEYLLFTDDSVISASHNLIEAMLPYAVRDGVGAVGCKVLADNGRIIDVGTVIRPSEDQMLGKTLYGFHGASTGYMGRLTYPHNVTALSRKCMMVRRTLFEKAGGFDEEFGPYGDIDLCLCLIKAGYRNVMLPNVSVRTCEKLNPTPEVQAGDEYLRRLTEKWSDVFGKCDPYYHPAFERSFSYGYALNYSISCCLLKIACGEAKTNDGN